MTCDPCPAFIISGFPYLAMVSFNTSTQKLALSVLGSRHNSTLRVAQCMRSRLIISLALVTKNHFQPEACRSSHKLFHFGFIVLSLPDLVRKLTRQTLDRLPFPSRHLCLYVILYPVVVVGYILKRRPNLPDHFRLLGPK